MIDPTRTALIRLIKEGEFFFPVHRKNSLICCRLCGGTGRHPIQTHDRPFPHTDKCPVFQAEQAVVNYSINQIEKTLAEQL